MKRMRAWAPWLVLLIILFAGIRRVSFDVNITALLPPDLRESQALSIFLRSFAQRHELIAVIDAPDAAAAGNALAAAEKALGRRPDLVSMVVSKPALDTDPEAAAGFLAWSLLNLPPSEWERTRQELQPARINERITSVQESMTTGLGSADGLLGYDPLGLASPVFRSLTGSGAATSAFASPDGRRRICFLRAPGDFSGWRAASRWIEAVRAVMEPAVQAHGATLGLTGHPVFESEAAQIMQYDMSTSGLGSLLLTVGIFWAFYRSLRPMLLVAAALILTAVLTLAAGGLLLPGMNVMTAGFAGILIGLVVDYGILIHQESLSTAPDDEVRKRSRHGITAAAATTATAFFSLTVCTVPGISGLGFLVGIGIVIGAVIMLGPCSRWLMKQRPRPAAAASTTGTGWLASDRADPWLASAAATLALLCFAGLAWKGPPPMDTSMECMRLNGSKADETMRKATAVLGRGTGLQWMFRAEDHGTMQAKLASAAQAIERATASGAINGASLPAVLWAHEPWRQENLTQSAAWLISEADRLRSAVSDAGYEPIAWALTERMMTLWRTWIAAGAIPASPPAESAAWLVHRFTRMDETGAALCVAMIDPAGTHAEAAAALEPEVSTDGMYLVSEELLSWKLATRVPQELFRILAVLVVCVLILLILTFRCWRSVLLCVLVMTVNLGTLLGAMAWGGISWNFFNLAALLLSLGTGIDYSIHVLIALRNGHDPASMRATTGRALLSCCLTTTAGFASLVTARLEGLVSMGSVCALALALNLLIALCLLPLAACRWLPALRHSRSPS
jgi:predicted exporter